MRTLLSLPLVALMFTACPAEPTPAPAPTAAQEPEAKKEEAKKEEPKVDPIEVGADDGGDYPEIVVEPEGDQMKFATEEITVKAGEKTRIKMKNTATVAAMVHNIVIVKKGSGEKVGQAAMAAGEAKHYVPAHADVIAATKLAKPGETTTVVVELPEGEYDFICTFPGHYMMMKGVVKAVAE